MGHLSCATILFSDPLLLVCGVHSFGLPCPSQERVGGYWWEGRWVLVGGWVGTKQPRGMRSPLSQRSIPWRAKFYKLSHHGVVTDVRAAPLTAAELPSWGASPWIPVCISACDRNNLPLGAQREVSRRKWQYLSWRRWGTFV